MIDRDERLEELRGALLAVAAADLEGASAPAVAPLAPPRSRRRPRLRARTARARLALAMLALALVVPGVAIATGMLSPEQNVANGLPAGSEVMVGTQPTCTALREGVEYRCVLAKTPAARALRPGLVFHAPGEFHGRPGEWRGYVVGTVGADKRVDGGCRSRNGVGTVWICFFGEAAVRHGIIAADYLGAYQPGPLQG